MKYIFNSPARVVVSTASGIDPILLASATLLAVAVWAVAWFLITFAVWLLVGSVAGVIVLGLWIWVLWRWFTVLHIGAAPTRPGVAYVSSPAVANRQQPVIVYLVTDEVQALLSGGERPHLAPDVLAHLNRLAIERKEA